MTTRKYSSRSQQTTLTASLNTSATTTTVVSASALLGGATISAGETFTVVIDADTALEEIVDVTAVSTNTLTITRGVENNGTGVAHSAGATVRHMAIGRDLREANTHIENVTSAHGLTIADVITTTNTKTLTNKTLTSPTITSATISGGTVTGLSSPTSGGDAATKTYVDAILGSATAASSSATAAASSATSAATSATSAATSASAAATSATSSATSATASASSATAAASSATSASTFATNAATSATSAATSATASATSATSSATSATASASSATAATSSATAAATSATSAAASATSAASSYTSVYNLTGAGLVRDMGSITDADTTTTSYVNISAFAAAAATSATSAATSATSSATSASAAATSASSAATSASNAAASDISAQNWATQLSTPVAGGEYSAKYHAQAAATSATSAATSASSAATSASSAATSASLAATIVASAVSGTLIDAKGDLLVGTANDVVARLPVGTDGYLLTVDSAQTSGIKWAAAPVSLPTQTGNSGKALTTDGTTASWSTTINGTAIPATKTLVVTTDKLSALAATSSTELAGVISDETGSGSLVFANTPTLVTPVLGVATATSINGTSIPSSKTLVATDSTVYVVPSQTGNSGKYLTTNGTASSWAAITTDPLPQIMMMMGA